MKSLKDIDINDSEALKVVEQEQLKWIDEQGLKRLVEHTRYDPPTDIDLTQVHKYARGSNIIAMTTVGLVSKEDWDKTQDKTTIDVCASGVALCSVKDQFNKRAGRVVATARAIESHQSQ